MRSGPKLRHLLSVCDIAISMEEGIITLTTIHKATYQSRQKEGATFSAVLDKAYRQMLKDSVAGFKDE